MSPASSGGSSASGSRTSPDSQYFPAIVIVSRRSSFTRFATSAEYRDSYSAGRMLSAIPPSTETNVLTPGTSFDDPTVYSATAERATIAHPGSTMSWGAGSSYRQSAPRGVDA